MNQNKRKNQVSLAGAARASEKEERRINPWKWIGIGVGLLALLIGGILLFRLFDKQEKQTLTAREMVEYEYTPDAKAGDVSYFLLGVTGDNIGDPMDMLAMMCYNRQTGSVTVMQIPMATYIDKDNGFAVDTIADVWSNPMPDVFCSSCRERVPADERDGEHHTTCGAALENRAGSPVNDLARVVNEQWGLPVDNYLIIPRKGLAWLIDAIEGVEVTLEKKITLAGESYAAGVQILEGQAALEYAVTYNYKGTPVSDKERMGRQRQVLASLWHRLSTYNMQDLYYEDDLGSPRGIIGKLMNGSDPLRFNTTSFGKARLLGVRESDAANIKLSDALSRFVYQMCQIPLSEVSFCILPGEATKTGTLSVYSVNRTQMVTFLNEQMNPFGLTINEDTVGAPQVNSNPKDADLTMVTLDTVLPETKASEEGEE